MKVSLSHMSDIFNQVLVLMFLQLLRIEEELGNVRYAGQSFRKPL